MVSLNCPGEDGVVRPHEIVVVEAVVHRGLCDELLPWRYVVRILSQHLGLVDEGGVAGKVVLLEEIPVLDLGEAIWNPGDHGSVLVGAPERHNAGNAVVIANRFVVIDYARNGTGNQVVVGVDAEEERALAQRDASVDCTRLSTVLLLDVGNVDLALLLP